MVELDENGLLGSVVQKRTGILVSFLAFHAMIASWKKSNWPTDCISLESKITAISYLFHCIKMKTLAPSTPGPRKSAIYMGLLDNFAKNKANPVVWNILSPFLNGDIVGYPHFWTNQT